MIALIDGDIVRYRTGFASNDVDERIALWRANETMVQILEAVGASEFRLYLSDNKDNNYRYKLFPGYKASREKQPKPRHHEALKDYLIREWDAVVTPDQEADDALGIDQTYQWELSQAQDSSGPYAFEETIICSIDKDLLQVPGLHYNWVRDERREVTAAEGIRSFYQQCLTGDRTDDVLGLKGIGPVKAGKALADCKSEHEHFQVVRSIWNDDEKLLMTARLLWVRRKEGELWEFPKSTPNTNAIKNTHEEGGWGSAFITQGTTQKSQSSSTMQKAIDHYSEHGTLVNTGAPERGLQQVDTMTTDFADWT